MTDAPPATPASTGRAKLLLRMILALGLLGLGLSVYLTWTTWSAIPVAGCGLDGTGDCDDVLASRWSKWLGVPVSLLGALTYVGILASATVAASRRPGVALSILLSLALLAVGCAVWFIGLQVFVLDSYCPYCMGVHGCSFLIGALMVLLMWSSEQPAQEEQMRAMLGVAPDLASGSAGQTSPVGLHLVRWTGLSAAGVAVLMAGQTFFRPAGLVFEALPDASLASAAAEDTAAEQPAPAAAATAPPASRAETDQRVQPVARGPRYIKFGGLNEPIDVTQMPILGSPDAKTVIVEMLDYTCPRCRSMHSHIRASRDRYGPQVAFVILHVPLSMKCNPHVTKEFDHHKNACDYARLSIGVWKVNRAKFVEYHEWLMESEKPPPLYDAKRYAIKLAGTKVLLDKSLHAESFRNIAGNSDDMKRINTGLPVFLVEPGIIRGVHETEDEWFQFLEKHLNLTPPGASLEEGNRALSSDGVEG